MELRYFANRRQEKDVPVVSQLPEVPKASKWVPPKASPEVELFLEKVRNDVLDQKPKDNLSKEEREALKSLRRDDQNVIRIQDKGYRFVVLDKNDYVEKMYSQLDHEYIIIRSVTIPPIRIFLKLESGAKSGSGKGRSPRK